jgi:transcriptional regulator with XRE-family HTH domain
LFDKLSKMNNLPNYLTQKYLEWQAQLGQRKTLEEFADHLDVSRPMLSFWMNGRRFPNEENIEKIAVKLGNDIYDALGLPRPNPYKQKIDRLWEFLPEDIQRRISEEAEDYEAKNLSDRVSKASSQRKKSKV